MSTLAELIEEGKRLNAAFQNACDFRSPVEATEAIAAKHTFFVEHGTRLLAVAEAAVEQNEALEEMVSTQEAWERAMAKVIKSEPGVFPRAIDRGKAALAAFDAVASGGDDV